MSFSAPSTVDSSDGARKLLTASMTATAATVPLNINTEALDTALLEMCRQLEDENSKQASQISTLKVELEEAQRDASVSKLIPHYRLVIMRTRNQVVELEEQLENEKESTRLLREKLDRISSDLDNEVT